MQKNLVYNQGQDKISDFHLQKQTQSVDDWDFKSFELLEKCQPESTWVVGFLRQSPGPCNNTKYKRVVKEQDLRKDFFPAFVLFTALKDNWVVCAQGGAWCCQTGFTVKR